MLTTPLCDLLGIRHPVIQGPLGGPWPPSVGLAAAVSNAGALGSLPTALRNAAQVAEDIAALRQLTGAPFAVNHTAKPYIEEVVAAILEARPAVVSFALGLRPDLVVRVHDAGSLFVQQVHTVRQAVAAAEAGADALIAQGGEAGGFGGAPATLVLVPQVVDAVRPVPVVAAGGIVDGRGLAAALALGAQGVTVGTRFLASSESEVAQGYKAAILAAESEQTVRASFVNELVPPATEGAYPSAPRVVRTEFVDQWLGRDDEVRREREQLGARFREAMAGGTVHELMVLAGESAGAVRDVLPAATIVERMVAEAEEVLRALAPEQG
jgi:nitronate monooxygenase/enoyl-[acyl-carrier protein] reductase II